MRDVIMTKRKKQRFTGVVYSTDESFEYTEAADIGMEETLDKNQQHLTVQLDKKARKGKMVTLVRGFVGTDEDLNALGRLLKQKCAVGGSSKDGEILIQGDFRERIAQVLEGEGYNVKILK